MRRFSVMLSAVILPAVAITAANAVTLNPRGLGQVLIYPYYTVNNSQDTYVSVANASDVGKVVTVEFLEGYNGRPVLDFLVFMSAHDVWTGSVSQIASDGGAKLVSQDYSCAVPSVDGEGNDIRGGGLPFSTTGYDGSGLLGVDGGPVSVTRTREGLIEAFAIADIVPGSPTDLKITHRQNGNPNNGVPADCTHLTPLAVGDPDLIAPTSGLYGSASIINVGEGTFFAYDASALTGFTSHVLLDPLGSLVSLAQANSPNSASDFSVEATILTESGQPLTLDYGDGIDAVSAVFMADAIYNDYLTSPELGAATDWVVTLPTKQFYVDPYYLESDGDTPNAAKAPFEDLLGATTPGLSYATIGPLTYDQEEGETVPPSFDGIPPPTVPTALPYQVNIVSFLSVLNDDGLSGVFGSSLTTSTNVAPYGSAGRVTLDLASGDGGHAMTSLGTVTLYGLPVVGFMVENVINANAQPGKLANYSGVFPHRSHVSCVLYGFNEPAPGYCE